MKPAATKRLVAAACRARTSAYAPYSSFSVGSAILTRSGKIFAGCNVENATLGATICAERSAVAGMVSAGERDPVVCAVVSEGGGPPCGICRQVLAEFADDLDLILVTADAAGRPIALEQTTLAFLLPRAFRLAAPTRSTSATHSAARAKAPAMRGRRHRSSSE